MSNNSEQQPKTICSRLLEISSCKQAALTLSNMMFISFILANLIAHQACLASGIFEINLAALSDSFGRDLRLECCAWQNLSLQANQQQQVGSQAAQQSAFHHHHHQINLHPSSHSMGGGNDAMNQQQSCDPTKCQLIIRICVKTYQTQIDPSQCTFGELSAQVMKPNEQFSASMQHYNQIQAASQTQSFARLQQQQQLQAYQKFKFNNQQAQQQQQQVSNIHHQRMLFQQQLQHYPSGLASLGQTQEQHSRQYHAPSLASGQARALRQIAFDQPISFPFNFTWPGGFSLVVDAWYESSTGLQQVASVPAAFAAHLPLVARHQHHHRASAGSPSAASATTTYDLYKKQLITQLSMHGFLEVRNEWTSRVHKTDSATLAYSYRVTCQPNYYGEQCNILCRPRDDFYGHFTCSQHGEVVCLPGWQGQYCEEPICLPGCFKDQGNCTRPNECTCRSGWQGVSCEQCVRYPGCVHGTCTKPHECVCEQGWGGLLCNEDLNYCNNHQPCKNGALCTNTFDVRGEGSYVCTCEEGFAGKNCEKKLNLQSANQSKQTSNHHSHQMDPMILTNSLSSLSSNNNNNNNNNNSATQASHTQAAGQSGKARSKSPSGTAAANAPMPPLSSYHFAQQPSVQAQATTQQAASNLDHRVIIAYGIIIVCMVILVVLAFLRVFFARLSAPIVGSNGGDSHRHRHSHRSAHQRSSRSRSRSAAGRSRHHLARAGYYTAQDLSAAAGDVATLQNHQNIYKSRSSLSTDKVAFNSIDSVDSAVETCSSSSLSSDSLSSADAGYNGHYHRSLAAAYGPARLPSGAATAGHYSASASLHYGPPPARYYPGRAAVAAAANYAHFGPHAAQYAPLAAAHSVHNISSTYQQLLRAAASTNNVPGARSTGANANQQQQQPPPPPYTAQQHSHPSSIYNASTLYGAVPAIVSSHAPHLRHAPSSTIYTNASNYGTAATLANQAVSSISTTGLTSATSSSNENNQANNTPSKQSTSSSNNNNNENNNNDNKNQEQASVGIQSQAQTTTETTSAANDLTNPYGNLQAANQQQQQQCYVILCNHHNFQSS